MRKPFILLKRGKEILRLVICILLSASAVSLFFLPDESVAVFNNGDYKSNSLFGLISSMV